MFRTPEDSIYQELEGLIQQELSKAQPSKNAPQAVITSMSPAPKVINSMSPAPEVVNSMSPAPEVAKPAAQMVPVVAAVSLSSMVNNMSTDDDDLDDVETSEKEWVDLHGIKSGDKTSDKVEDSLDEVETSEAEEDLHGIKSGGKTGDKGEDTLDENHDPVSETDLAKEFGKWINERHARHNQKNQERHDERKKALDDDYNSTATDGHDVAAQQVTPIEENTNADTLPKDDEEVPELWGRLQHEQASAEEEFLFNAAKKALQGKDKALAEASHNDDLQKDAEQRVQAADQLIKDVETKKRNALKLAAETAKAEKKKAEKATTEALAHAAAYQRELEKGKQEHDEVDRAKALKDRYLKERETLSKEIQTLAERVQAQQAIAASAAVEASEEKRLADKVNSVLGESDRVQDLKDAARAAAESRKRLEDEFRHRAPEELDGEEFAQGLIYDPYKHLQ